jgi:gluconolactonase
VIGTQFRFVFQEEFMRITRSAFVFMFIIVTCLVFNHNTLAVGKSPLVAPGASMKLIQSGFQGAEGPAVDADGNVYFSDAFLGLIYKWTWKDGKVALYKEKTGQALGLAFDAKGFLIKCELTDGRITRDDMKGNITVIADSCDGKKFHKPNDLWIDPKGGVYFSDMYIPEVIILSGGRGGASGENPDGARGAGTPGSELQGGVPGGTSERPSKSDLGIVYISPDAKKVIRVANDIDSPNGLIGTPDGKILYVGDQGKVWSYKINPDGTLADKKLFCEKNTDGFAIDEKNNVYLGDKSLLIYSPAGELLEEEPSPEGIANFKFAGKDHKTLFITHRGSVYTLDMAVRGAPTAIDQARDMK